jgi:rhodanese-related sulfurtransferase
MRYIIFILLLAATTVQAQFKSDNVKYTTVFPEDLCKTLQANPGYTILDVRSKGEYDDTSASGSLNIGHIKNALHIDIRQLPARWKELNAYKDKPLFIYCSHSQRSRRASRLLADSGFTKVFNINAGLTDFYLDAAHIPTCTEYLVTQDIPYKIVAPAVMTKNIMNGTSYFLIDLRSDSIFNGTTLVESKKAQGRFQEAINIPFATLNDALSKIPKDKNIMLIDEFGNDSPKAARMMVENG